MWHSSKPRPLVASLAAAAIWLTPLYGFVLWPTGGPGDAGVGVGLALLALPVLLIVASGFWWVVGRYLVSERLLELRHYLVGGLAVALFFAAALTILLLRSGDVASMLLYFTLACAVLSIPALIAGYAWWYLGAAPHDLSVRPTP